MGMSCDILSLLSLAQHLQRYSHQLVDAGRVPDPDDPWVGLNQLMMSVIEIRSKTQIDPDGNGGIALELIDQVSCR
jgi:hypothetical protein